MNLEARARQLKCLGDQRAISFRPGHSGLNAWGLPEIFPRAQPCSPVVIGSMIHYMLLFNVEVHFFKDINKGNANFSELPNTLNIYGGNIHVSFVLSGKGTPVCNSSSSRVSP